MARHRHLWKYPKHPLNKTTWRWCATCRHRQYLTKKGIWKDDKKKVAVIKLVVDND